MKLIVPHVGQLEAADARLIRLAEFLGISCESLLLEKGTRLPAAKIENESSTERGCFVVNPRVIKEWTAGLLPLDLATCLTSQYPFLLVHGLSSDPFCQDLTRSLSIERLQSVRPIADSAQVYEIASDMREVCGPFSGASFGPVNSANDYTFSVLGRDAGVRTPISIGGEPFMAVMKRGAAEILFLASADTMDVNSEVSGRPLSEYFSRFVPHAMALRYIFSDQCWHPQNHYASFIIDDPLLRPKYGHLDFGALLSLMKEHNFSTTVAFIPHNYRRNRQRTVQLFRQNSDRLSICFHGNDHTAAEFASTDISQLNTMIRIADDRMDIHTSVNKIPCDKVMVFPQEKFSIEAMKVLKSHNFLAGVNSGPQPAGRRAAIALRDLAQPAILRYAGFPLFLRKYVGQVERQDVAFSLFFGRPILIVDHHDVFRQTDTLVETVLMINSMTPDIRWCNLATAVTNSTLRRTGSNGTCYVKAFAGAIGIANEGDTYQRFSVEWLHSDMSPSVGQVLQDGVPTDSFDVDSSAIRVSVVLAPHRCQALSVIYRNDYPRLERLGFRWGAKAFIRRRLSEARDNYISKNRFAAAVAQIVQHRVLSKIF